MKHLLTMCALLSVLAKAAEPVFLVDEEGTRHGPFELRNQAEVPLRGHVYKVQSLPDDARVVVEALQKTRLPPFKFTDAPLPDLLRFASESVAKQNPNLAGLGFLVVDAPPEEKPTDAAAVAQPPAPLATMEGQALTAWDFLRRVAELSNYRLDVDAKGVRLLHPRIPDGPLYTQLYHVLPTFIDRACIFLQERGGQPDAAKGALDLKAFLRGLGVDWPDGSSVRYRPEISMIEVVNTLSNHRLMNAVLGVLDGGTAKQVEIDCQFVAIPRAALEKPARGGRISSEAILSLVHEGQSTLLASPKVVTKNGSEATIKGVIEYIYPTEFIYPTGLTAPTETNAQQRAGGAVVEPGGFETREAGVILQVVPDVTPDGSMINLTLAPQVVNPPKWRDFAVPEGESVKGAVRPAPMEQPFFPVDSIATSVQVYSGRTVVIGGGAPSPDGKTFTYMLLTATLVDPAGNEVHTDLDVGALFPAPQAVP